MRFYVRVSLALVLGVLAGGASAFLAEKWWVIGLAAAFTAMILFLATFFIWDADRAPTPEEPAGYEQVLFDKRNLTHLAVLSVLLVSATYGLNLYAESRMVPTAVDPAAAELDAAYDELALLADSFNTANGAFVAETEVGDLQVHIDEAERIRLALGAIGATGSLADAKSALEDSAAYFGAAFTELRKCVNESTNPCIEARIAQAEAIQGLETYAST